MTPRLAGRVALIAGAASGIGAAIAHRFRAEGAEVVALTRSIANGYGHHGVRANCLCPGWVRTPMSEAEVRVLAAARGVTTEAVWEELRARIATARAA